MIATCRHCGKDIARVFVGSEIRWGHVTNPGPDHHYAVPADPVLRSASRSVPGAGARRAEGGAGQRVAS